MRNSRLKTVTVTLAVPVILAVALTGCGSGSSAKAAPGYASREAMVVSVEVTATPTRVDARGAEIRLAFNTHSGNLAMDVARSSTLLVDGRRWTSASWEGSGPGGHHRAGTVRFDATGPARGQVRLTLAGLAEPVEFTWSVPSGN